MKKISSILLLGAAIASCSSPADKGFEINGAYADSIMDSKSLYLMAGDSIIDSTVVKGANFEFKGTTDSVSVYRIAGKAMMKGQVRYNTLTNVILKQGTKLSVKVSDVVDLDDNGGDNFILSTFMNDYRSTMNEDMKVYQEMMANKVSQDSLMAFVNEKRAKMDSIWKNAVKENAGNVAGAAIFADFSRGIRDAAEFESMVKDLKYANLFPQIKAQQEFNQNLLNTAEGKMFVDFTGKNLENKDAKLSDYVGKGKYVLVDFWASWCGPCRREIPNIIDVDKKYKGDKFMVLGVDVWDQEDKFKAALEEEKVTYDQLFTVESSATSLYGISGIPQIMLFGPDGKILKRNLRGDAIAETVKEYLKK